jgi:hypothetical protein
MVAAQHALQADSFARWHSLRGAGEAQAVGRTREAICVEIMLYNIRQCNLGEESA